MIISPKYRKTRPKSNKNIQVLSLRAVWSAIERTFDKYAKESP